MARVTGGATPLEQIRSVYFGATAATIQRDGAQEAQAAPIGFEHGGWSPVQRPSRDGPSQLRVR